MWNTASKNLWPAAALLGMAACAESEARQLAPTSVAMADTMAPSYDDGELTIYEAKTGLMLPIIAPRQDQLETLSREGSDPFERQPWVSRDDVEVQITWTLSNLDSAARNVWVMIDPWNEFARYEPAIQVEGDEAIRDLSGIDMLFLVPGTDDPSSEGRLVGTFTFEDMAELALDFATVFKILSDAVPADAEADDPRPTLVNHAFNVRNRSYNSPLLSPYQPSAVPGLVGFDFGVRTSEPANVALEIAVELIDHRGNRVAERGQAVTLLEAPQLVISSAGGP